MFLTICLSLIIIFSVTLLLYSGVALIQNRKLFGSAPKDIQEALTDHEERFKGAHLLGWILAIISALLILFAIVYGAWDGIKNHFGFWDFFVRFLIMLTIYKLYDMLCFDWFLLTKSNFYQHYFPETRNCKSYNHYGFNIKSQLLKLFIIFPLVALLLAFIVSSL